MILETFIPLMGWRRSIVFCVDNDRALSHEACQSKELGSQANHLKSFSGIEK